MTRPDHTRLDALVAELLDPVVNDPAFPYHHARASRNADIRLRIAIDGAARRVPAKRRYRLRRGVVAAAVVAMAASVAVTLVPGDRLGVDGSGRVALSGEATAAEAMQWAGAALVGDGDLGAGSGSIWHSVSVTYEDGRRLGATETWTDPRSGALRSARLDTPAGPPRAFLQVSELRPDGMQAVRSYRRRGDEPWAPFGDYNLDVPGGIAPQRYVPAEAGDALRIGATATVEEATVTWLRDVERADSRAALRGALRKFMVSTRGWFVGFRGDAPGDVARITSVRQLVYLVSVAQATPEATQVLYDGIRGFGGMRRLDDVVVDDRRAVRIQFDTTDHDDAQLREGDPVLLRDAATRGERVLVVDGETGRVVRTESVDRTRWTTIDAALRTTGIGDDPALCGSRVPEVPCSLIAGTGAVAEAAGREAGTADARRLAGELATPLVPYRVTPDGRRLGADGAVVERGPSDGRGQPVPVLPPVGRLPDDGEGR